MKPVFLFIRATITGGIIFMLPVVLLIILLSKAYSILEKLSSPISESISFSVLGMDGSILIVIFLMVLICFISGLLFRSKQLRKWIGQLEKNVLIFIPGYALTKTITADVIGETVEQKMSPVLIEEGECWNLGFLVEEGEKHSTIFIPDAPSYDAGEVRIVPTQSVRKLDMSVNKFTQSIKVYGKGAIHWVQDQS